MDVLMNTLNVLGFLLALYSLYQSRQASQIAREVEEKIQKNRHTSEMSKLSACLDVAIQEVKIFGPISSAEKLRGVDHHKVAEKVQDFILMLRDCLSLFKSAEKQKAKKLCEDLPTILEEFGDGEKNIEERKDSGRKILSELSGFSSILKASLNKKIDRS